METVGFIACFVVGVLLMIGIAALIGNVADHGSRLSKHWKRMNDIEAQLNKFKSIFKDE